MNTENTGTGRLNDRVIVVTGAAQGIGRAYAKHLAGEGATVVLTDINEGGAAQGAKEIREAGGTAQGFRLDVSSPEDLAAFPEQLGTEHAHVDGLVNNAALFSALSMKPFWEIPLEEWDRLMAVNLRGPWLLTSALLPLLRKAGSASVVNISSDAAWMGRPGYLHYIASKAGVAGMTNSMARELGEFGIRVNAVAPGPVFTEIPRDTVTPAQKEAMLGQQALHRAAGPDDIIGTVGFLLSDDSAFVTGQTLHVNGGLVHP